MARSFICLCFFVATLAAAAPTAVPTFECIGLYWPVAKQGDATVRFRAAGVGEWSRGLDLVYDTRDNEYRGSLVGLAPDTAYDIELTAGTEKATLATRTRSDRFPVGKTTHLPAGDSYEAIVIKESGTPEAYHLVTPPPGRRSTLDAMNRTPANIVVDADYVIVRGAELKNAATHGVLIKAGRHDVVVEHCRITFWGGIGGPISYGNTGDMHSGVYAERGCGRLTIQRNLIEHPRGASNDWDTGHPHGPQGISFHTSTGQNVVRYNDIWSTEDHGFNDGIGGAQNYSAEGNMNRDSDIHGNIIRNVWDDAIECEGANMNVRIWGNYLHYFFNGVATAATTRGPLYIFRNVWGESRRTHVNPLGGSAIKTGEREPFGGGRKYIFHNTALQPRGIHSAFTSHVNPNCVTRNNIFDCPGPLATRQGKEPASDYDYDYFSGSDRGTAREAHGVRGPMGWVKSYALEFYLMSRVPVVRYGKIPSPVPGEEGKVLTDPVVSASNPAIDAGVALPNFNDGFAGKAPDLGAFENGRPPLRFGRRANLAPEEGWAPWELY